MPGMSKKVKLVQQNVMVLRSPEPRFVSLVDHGANQEPFLTVKHAGIPAKGVKAMPMKKSLRINRAKKSAPAANPDTTPTPKAKTAVRSLEFPTANYKTADEVTTWLEANDWNVDELTITPTKKSFLVTKNDDADELYEDDDRQIDIPGTEIMATVATLKAVSATDNEEVEEEDADAEADTDGIVSDSVAKKAKKLSGKLMKGSEYELDGITYIGNDKNEPVVKTAENAKKFGVKKDAGSVKKYDWWNAYVSKEGDVIGVLKDGMSDGVPPGVDAIMDAAYNAVGNVLKAGGDDMQSRLDKIGTEMSELIFSVHGVFSGILEDDEASDELKVAAKAHVDALADVANQQTSAKSAKGDVSADTGNAVVKALEAITKRIDGLTDETQRATEEAKKANETVKKITSKVPARKSMATDDEPTVTTTTTKKSEEDLFLERQRKHVFGFGIGGNA